MGDESNEPKIVTGSDFSEQVEAEKEALRQAEIDAAEKPTEEAPTGFPPPSFTSHVSMLATQAIGALGILPDPSGNANVDRAVAKHIIDTLEVLEKKTAGNLTDEEQAMMKDILHQLRMAYVSVPAKAAEEEKPESPIVVPESKIELP